MFNEISLLWTNSGAGKKVFLSGIVVQYLRHSHQYDFLVNALANLTQHDDFSLILSLLLAN